jgi:D-hexose-6-phosphate mutarotase
VADESEILIFGPDYDSGWDKAYGFDQEYPDSVVSVCEANFQAAETIHNDQASDLVRYDPWQDRSDTTKQVTERNNKRLLKLCLSGAIRLKNNMSCEEWLE